MKRRSNWKHLRWLGDEIVQTEFFCVVRCRKTATLLHQSVPNCAGAGQDCYRGCRRDLDVKMKVFQNIVNHGENAGTLGMVPLIIDAIYTL